MTEAQATREEQTSKLMHPWEKTVRSYYELVDRGDYEAMYSLFGPEIKYSREGTGDIRGMNELRKFYEGGRIIDSGGHQNITVDPNFEGGGNRNRDFCWTAKEWRFSRGKI